jgi:hypothetical protein
MILPVEALHILPRLFQVTAVRATGLTSVHVTFDDGLSGEIDLDRHLPWQGIFAELKANPALFAQVFVDPESKVVAWPNGADMDSEVLHARLLWELAQRGVEIPTPTTKTDAVPRESNAGAISRFLGIEITIRPTELDRPHFQARYGDDSATIQIGNFAADGTLSPRALAFTIEWAALHQAELLADWRLVCAGKAPLPIEPLV